MGALTGESGEEFVKGFAVTPPKLSAATNGEQKAAGQGTTLRTCLRDPIPEIFQAAFYLDEAVVAHLDDRPDLAKELIRRADMPVIRDWTESLWGTNSPYVKPRKVELNAPVVLAENRATARMPTPSEERELLLRDGHHCRFCGIPVITKTVRDRVKEAYPDALSWLSNNQGQHAAFQAMWLQYDHLLPHARGGGNNLENIVVTCAPCNYGRGIPYTVEEVGLINPTTRDPVRSSWDGLDRMLRARN